jgi:Holliday junction resolvase RusA-like endonuclease
VEKKEPRKKKVRLIIPGTLIGFNQYSNLERRNRHLAAQKKAEEESRIILAAKPKLNGMRFKRPVVMHYTWFEPDRRRDKDNIAFARKFVQDALVKSGVLNGDGWRDIEGFSDEFHLDAKYTRVEVYIEEV